MIATHYATGSGTTGANMIGRSRIAKDIPPVRQGIVFLYGLLGQEYHWQEVGTDHATVLMEYLSGDDVGFRFMSIVTGSTWGNDTVITRITDAWSHAQANYGFATTRVHLVGISMGAVCALNWAKSNLSKVASLSLIIPTIDIQDIDDNNRLPNLNPNIGYGGTGGFPAGGFRPPDDHNPADNAASYASIAPRIKLWYSNNDSICLPGLAQSFIATSGASAVNMGDQVGLSPTGHGALNLDPTQVAAHIALNDSDPVNDPALDDPARLGFFHAAGRGQ